MILRTTFDRFSQAPKSQRDINKPVFYNCVSQNKKLPIRYSDYYGIGSLNAFFRLLTNEFQKMNDKEAALVIGDIIVNASEPVELENFVNVIGNIFRSIDEPYDQRIGYCSNTQDKLGKIFYQLKLAYPTAFKKLINKCQLRPALLERINAGISEAHYADLESSRLEK